MISITIAAILAFVAGILLFAALGTLALERAQIFKSLRQARTIELVPTDLRKRELAVPFMQRVAIPVIKRLAGISKRFAPAGVVERLQQDLLYAGSPAAWDAERILAIKFLLGLGAPVASFLITAFGGLGLMRSLIFAGLLGFVGWYGPEWVLRSRAGQRQYKIQRALPDALDLLSITVEAGLAFDAAVSRVARQAGGPLGEELFRVLQEMQLGANRGDALRGLGDRTSVQELKSFVLAMIQADVFGISISKVLHQQAAEMRVKRRQRAEEKAQKLQVKIIFPLILCIFPALFVVLLGPAALTIYDAMVSKG